MNEKVFSFLEIGLKRIFCLTVTAMTYREVYNLLQAAAEGDKEKGHTLLESLVTKKMGEGWTEVEKERLRKLSDLYSISIRFSKEVMERGEFLSLLTSDTLNNSQQQPLFLNRLRRIDGEDFQFLTDPLATTHLLSHFTSRLADLSHSEGGAQLMKNLSGELLKIRGQIDSLLEPKKAKTPSKQEVNR